MVLSRPKPPDADNGHEWYDAEDCLQVNVFSPVINSGSVPDETAPKLPVMFFSELDVYIKVCRSQTTHMIFCSSRWWAEHGRQWSYSL